ncbi:MAG TPA: class I SAM-dependent methyltransferase [Patescibacteria group bacterium]|nr:class I SAM-dependent methyltransferase [Patescibacteria group bacterium]
MKNDWQEYYNLTRDRAPSKLLMKALGYVKDKGRALDLGAGALNDTRYLLKQGFSVLAIDKEQLPKDVLKNITSAKFVFKKKQFEQFEIPRNRFDLVNAQYSLPFVNKNNFARLWPKIVNSLRQGGIFTGQFFGIGDDWNDKSGKMSFFDREGVLKKLEFFHIISLKETKKIAPLALGGSKFWHLFNIIAKKSDGD